MYASRHGRAVDAEQIISVLQFIRVFRLDDICAKIIAELRRVMDDGGVTWQMAELGKMEKGGGGTIAQYMSRFGMKVIDMGTPLLNMHAPWEIASKFDCWQTYCAYAAYLHG